MQTIVTTEVYNDMTGDVEYSITYHKQVDLETGIVKLTILEVA